jgi:DNA-binding HxlR family transcriptional regulator
MDEDGEALAAALEAASPEELSGRLRDASRRGRPLFVLLGRAGALEIIYEVGVDGPVRFTELKEALSISSATLSARLSELADAGLVERTSYDEIPPRVEYSATEKLADLKPALYHLMVWAERHGFDVEAENAVASPTEDGNADGGRN